MPDRAAIIITDATAIRVAAYDDLLAAALGDMDPLDVSIHAPLPQLLADLRTLAAPWASDRYDAVAYARALTAARARVRALLPKEEPDAR